MNQETEDIRLAAAVLKAHLKGILNPNGPPENPVSISEEDLTDFLEGRLVATEREDLIERLAKSGIDRERLADLLVGYDQWENERASEAAPAKAPSVLAALHDWARQAMDFLSPVLAYSRGGASDVDLIEFAKENNLLATLDFQALDDSFKPRATEIRTLMDSGQISAQLLNVQAAVMEVHLVLSRDRRGAPAGFFMVWKPVTVGLGVGSSNDWDDAYRVIQQVYGRAIEIDPTYSEAFVGVARIDLQLGNLDRAEENLEKAASLNPSEASAYHLLAQIRNRKKN